MLYGGNVKIAGKLQALVAIALLGVGLVAAGCKSAPELTKQQALTMIQAKLDSNPGTPVDINVDDRGMQQGVSAGYWVGVKRYPNGYWADLKVTPAGQKAFKLLSGKDTIEWRPLSPQDPHYAITVTSLTPVKEKARGLGDIQDDGSDKTVTFSEDLDLSTLPAPLAAIAQNPGNRLSSKQTAKFVLNNGTWTLQSIG
jgi:hypothetical protein